MADDPNPNPEPAPATDPAPDPASTDPEYPEGLGDAGKKAIEAERKARREAEAKLKELEPLAAKAKELEDAQKTEQQKLQDALDAAKADGAKATAEAAKLRAAIEHGLSKDDLDLLGNGTPDEIDKRAKRLAERLAGAAEGTPIVPASRNQGAGDEPPAVDADKIVDSIPRP